MDFINKQTEGLSGRNSFSVGIDATKVVNDVRPYQCYNAIVGGVHTKYCFCVDGTTMFELHESIELTRSKYNKSDHTFEVKI